MIMKKEQRSSAQLVHLISYPDLFVDKRSRYEIMVHFHILRLIK